MTGNVVDLAAYRESRAAREAEPEPDTVELFGILDAAFDAGRNLASCGQGLQYRAAILTQFLAGFDDTVDAAAGGAR